MASAGEAALGALELRECARGSSNFHAAAPAHEAGGGTAAAADSTYERSEARNGARSTSCTVALAAAGSEAAQSKRAVALPLGSRHATRRTRCFKEAAWACCVRRFMALARQNHRQGSSGYHPGRAGPLARLLRAARGRGRERVLLKGREGHGR